MEIIKEQCESYEEAEDALDSYLVQVCTINSRGESVDWQTAAEVNRSFPPNRYRIIDLEMDDEELIEAYQEGYDAGVVDSNRKCIDELKEILEALAANTTDSNKRIAGSGLSLIADFRTEYENQRSQ